MAIILSEQLLSFQSTLPCGSDDFYWPSFAHLGISIHAPLRERLSSFLLLFRLFKFQSTLPCGSDLTLTDFCKFSSRFQSTLPCGSDHKIPLYCYLLLRFQSTLPCGSDYVAKYSLKKQTDFNPRSLAGATCAC